MNQTNQFQNTQFQSFTGFSAVSYLRFLISIVGILTNITNMSILINPRLKDIYYKYLFATSIANLLYHVFCFLAEFFLYCINCEFSQSFFAAAYGIFIWNYFCNCLIIFRVIVQLTLSIYIYCSLTKRSWFCQLLNRLVVTILIMISLLCYAYVPFSFNIVQSDMFQNTSDFFLISSNSFGNSDSGKALRISITLIRLFIQVCVLFVFNVVNAVKFKKWFKNHQIGIVLVYIQSRNSRKSQTLSINIFF